MALKCSGLTYYELFWNLDARDMETFTYEISWLITLIVIKRKENSDLKSKQFWAFPPLG